MLPQKILKIDGLRMHFDGSMIEGKSELKNVDIIQTVNLQIGFVFSAEAPLCTYFTVLENVTI